MNITQLLLGKLAEECIEVAKEALKAQQFGFDEGWDGKTNRERIHKELNDVNAIIDMLNDRGLDFHEVDEEAVRVKKEKVIKYLKLSRERGQLNCSVMDVAQLLKVDEEAEKEIDDYFANQSIKTKKVYEKES